MFGFVCSAFLRTIRFSSIVRGKGGRLEPLAIGVSIVLVVWTAAIFHVLAQAFCRYAFETKFGNVHQVRTAEFAFVTFCGYIFTFNKKYLRKCLVLLICIPLDCRMPIISNVSEGFVLKDL
jgi:hypothetical protein